MIKLNLTNEVTIMEIIFIVVFVVGVLAYYGVMRSVEIAAGIGEREVRHRDRQHKVAIMTRTQELNKDVSEAKLKATKKLIEDLDSLDL